jgi:hypothetical protein
MATTKRTYSKRPIMDPNEVIALAAERELMAYREAEAWIVVNSLAHAHALHAPGADAAALQLAAAARVRADAEFVELMADDTYSSLPPLSVTHTHLHGLLVSLHESLSEL